MLARRSARADQAGRLSHAMAGLRRPLVLSAWSYLAARAVAQFSG
jgi:hypothetical protein